MTLPCYNTYLHRINNLQGLLEHFVFRSLHRSLYTVLNDNPESVVYVDLFMQSFHFFAVWTDCSQNEN